MLSCLQKSFFSVLQDPIERYGTFLFHSIRIPLTDSVLSLRILLLGINVTSCGCRTEHRIPIDVECALRTMGTTNLLTDYVVSTACAPFMDIGLGATKL